MLILLLSAVTSAALAAALAAAPSYASALSVALSVAPSAAAQLLSSDQDQGPTLHESIARQDHLLMIAETRTTESRGSKQAVVWVVGINRT